MIAYIQKDITTVDEGVIAHGVNCQAKMGSGVAKALYTKWPQVRSQYLNQASGSDMLGRTDVVVIVPDKLFVANCYTQEYYGSDGKRYADPRAIEFALWNAYAYADFCHLPIYLPKIGAGLGGLDWDTEVEPIVQYADAKWPRVDTYVCEI